MPQLSFFLIFLGLYFVRTEVMGEAGRVRGTMGQQGHVAALRHLGLHFLLRSAGKHGRTCGEQVMEEGAEQGRKTKRHSVQPTAGRRGRRL